MKKLLLTALIAISFASNAAVTKTSPVLNAVPPDCVTNNATAAGTGGDLTDVLTFIETGTVSDVNVFVSSVGDWRNEIQVDLNYNGADVILLNALTTNAPPDSTFLVNFDSDAVDACNTVCNDFANCTTGNESICSPVDSLSVFNGAVATAGDWTIRYCDSAFAGGDQFTSWAITVDGDDQLPVELMNLEID